MGCVYIRVFLVYRPLRVLYTACQHSAHSQHSLWNQFRLQYHGQGNLDMWTGVAGDRPTDLPWLTTCSASEPLAQFATLLQTQHLSGFRAFSGDFNHLIFNLYCTNDRKMLPSWLAFSTSPTPLDSMLVEKRGILNHSHRAAQYFIPVIKLITTLLQYGHQ